MAKIVMFMRSESVSGEKERNNQFRVIVSKYLNEVGMQDADCFECSVNTPFGFNRVFEQNPDCELVFTTQGNSEAQYQACDRNIPTYEWECFDNGEIRQVQVEKDYIGRNPIYNVSYVKQSHKTR